ncbi:MAG: hypothetical protein A2X59_04610 [Nitrospirae bacterium GWC2_42_7]|nr:MAG: hypothetical protein A2X59_04610 [Nitrospirae bacterium GWC2_42_7]
MIFRKSITAKFITSVFIILLAGQLTGAVILFLHTKSTLLKSLQKRIDKTATTIAGVSSAPLLNYDYASIDSYLEETVKDEDINSVHISDMDGKVIREKVMHSDTDIKTINPFLLKKTMALSVPVTASGGKIGELKVNYSAKSVNESISKSMILISLVQGILLVVLGAVMMFLFNRDIKKPVGKIIRAIEKITSGDLTAQVPDVGENEIGSIGKGIIFLKEKLLTTVTKLNSTAVNVSMAITQVEMMYKTVTNGIDKQSAALKDIMQSTNNASRSQSEILANTEKLSSFSAENVSSLLETKATAEEIAVNTQRLYKATEDSYSVVVEMTQTAKAISTNASEAVSAVEDTSSSVEEIGVSIKEVEDHARESSALAEKVKEIASETGMLAVVNAVEGMEGISVEVKKSAEIITHLGARSTDIEKVLSVIKDVTEQTNLLSLNAAILAAQAGEYGKSFSVVADEIRGLSERTASSAREIGLIVKNIQKDIKDAVRSIDKTQLKVDEGNTLVIHVGEALRETLTASIHSTEMTKAIEKATEEQSIGLRQITVAMDDIRKMMSSVARSTGEQEKSLSYLLDSAGEVREVADISKRGTEEQATGTKIISKNLELANEKIIQINQAVSSQKKLNDGSVAAMEQIRILGESTVNDMQEVSNSLNTLFEEIGVLKKEMEVFKTR